jgi:hypothetical protein
MEKFTLQQPQMNDDDRAASPATQQGESRVSAVNLQEKMWEAAMKCAELEFSSNEYRDIPSERYIAERVLPHIGCTPEDVFFRLGEEWIKITQENLTAAFRIVWPAYKSCHGTMARWWLSKLRQAARKSGRVSWVLPKLKGVHSYEYPYNARKWL